MTWVFDEVVLDLGGPSGRADGILVGIGDSVQANVNATLENITVADGAFGLRPLVPRSNR